jgi:precorrin-6B methylase 2
MNALDVIAIGLALAVLISIVLTSLRVGISPMPSSRKAQKAIITAIAPDTRGLIFDLGSGWGNLAFPLARSFPQAAIRGIELSLLPWAVSRIRASLFGPSNLDIQRGNFQDISLGEAEVIVCYLFPGAMTSLKTKFENELKPNTLIVSNTFRLAGWEPEEIITLDDIHHTPIYRYRVPAK